jgi:hypothetical protein
MSTNTKINNQRVPLLSLTTQKKKGENIFNNTRMTNKHISEDLDYSMDEEEKKSNNKIHHYNTRSQKDDKRNNYNIEEDDKHLGDIEFTKVILKSLKEALCENEKVSFFKNFI